MQAAEHDVHPGQRHQHQVAQHQGQCQQDGGVKQHRHLEQVFEVVGRFGRINQQLVLNSACAHAVGMNVLRREFGDAVRVHLHEHDEGQQHLRQQRVKQRLVEHRGLPPGAAFTCRILAEYPRQAALSGGGPAGPQGVERGGFHRRRKFGTNGASTSMSFPALRGA